jgi:hypothetical protein
LDRRALLVGVEWEVGGLVVLRREASGEMRVVEEISFSGEGSDESEWMTKSE